MLETNAFKVKFWGVRGSYPTPGDETVRYGGNTACVEVTVAGQTIILDAGTGIVGLGRDLLRRSLEVEKPITATLLFSHMHHDHTQGFPFFAPAFVLHTSFYLRPAYLRARSGTCSLPYHGAAILSSDLERNERRQENLQPVREPDGHTGGWS